jgi:hypothetical protein
VLEVGVIIFNVTSMYTIKAVYFRVVSQRKKKVWEQLMMPAVPYMLPFMYIEEAPTMRIFSSVSAQY